MCKNVIVLSVVFVLSLLVIAAAADVGAAAPVSTEQWNETFGGTQDDTANSVVQTEDGGFVFAGTTFSFGSVDEDAWLVKTDPDGNVEFNRTRTFEGSKVSSVNSVRQTSDGGFVLAGQSSGPDAWLAKTDENGIKQWNKTFNPVNSVNEAGLAVEQTSDGGFALVGESFNVNDNVAWLVKTDRNGEEQWNRTYGSGLQTVAFDELRSIQQTSDGGFVLAGGTDSFGSGSEDAWLVKTDPNGNEQWNRTFDGTRPDDSFAKDDFAHSVRQTTDSGFVLAATTRFDGWLIRTHSNGEEQWNRTFDDIGTFSVRQTFDGGFVLAGDSSFGSTASDSDGWVAKTDSDGNEQWNRTYGGPEDDVANSIQQASDGSFVFAGGASSFGAGQSDAWLAKTGCVDTTGDGDPDSDGDALCDNWEENGVDIDGDGNTDLDLPAMGADPNRKDIFLEMDYMRASPGELLIGHLPQQNALQNVANAFANAPVPNPDGSQGINLHLRVDGSPTTPRINLSESQALAHRNVLNYTGNGPAADFDNLKDRHFGAPGDSDETRLARRLTHRYAIFAHRIEQGSISSGRAEGIPGNDFIVTLGRGGNVGNRVGQESTLMHEFGHTLGLRHGGGDDVNCKPNYLSVMSYSFQFPNNVRRSLDYSRQQLPTLNENNLNEAVGVQGPAGRQTLYDAGDANFDTRTGPANGPIDWNNDTDMADNAVARDINWLNSSVVSGCNTPRERGMTQLRGHNDWANIEYNFRNVPAFADGVHPTPPGTQEQPAPPVAIGSTSSALAVETNVSSVEADETTGVAVNVTSAGIPVDNATVNVTGAGVDVSNATTDANGTATFSLTPDETGDITVTASKPGFPSNRTTVEAGSSVVDRYDTDGDGIDTGELQNAINDFIQRVIDTGDLQAIINNFVQSQS